MVRYMELRQHRVHRGEEISQRGGQCGPHTTEDWLAHRGATTQIARGGWRLLEDCLGPKRVGRWGGNSSVIYCALYRI